MNINKNVSIWRGDDTPPTQFHLWLKGDRLYHNSDLGWEENKIDLASIEKDGLMSKEDKKRLDNIVCNGLDNIIYDGLDSEDDSKALSAKLGNILLNKILELNLSVYLPKGSVNSFEELPILDLRVGDVYNIVNSFYIEDQKYPAGTNVVWMGSKWDPLGGTIDLSDYSTTEQVEVLYSELNSKLSEYQNNTNQLIEEKSLEATAALAAEVTRASEQESRLSTSISDLNLSLITESSRATAAEEALKTSKVDKVEGKSLVSDDQIVKLTNLDNQDDITSNIADAKKAGTDALSSLDSHTSNVSNPHNVTKNLIGLGNVDNTSDLNKPISTATQTELNKKVDKIEGKGLSTEDYTTADKTKLASIANGAQINSITGVKGGAEESYRTGNVNITAANLGLGNVNNTSDADKPISTATQTALNNKVDKVTGKGLSSEDYTSAEKTKLSGIEAGAQVNTIIGIKGSSESSYRTGNVSISPANIGLGNVNNTSDLSKPISTATQSALNGKVDKVSGKGLSSEDYTKAEKDKLTGIEAGAQVNTVTGIKGNAETNYRTGNINITPTNIGLGNVNNTSDLNKPVSTAQQTALDKKVDKVTGYGLSKNDFTDTLKNKLNGIAEGAQVNSITGVKGSSEGTYRTGNVSISASNIGLGNVDNTSDVDKPISTATQTALNGKVSTTVKVNGHALNADVTVSKNDIGLGNVDNTSDLNKPISTATQTALNKKVDKTYVDEQLATKADKADVDEIDANLNVIITTVEEHTNSINATSDIVSSHTSEINAINTTISSHANELSQIKAELTEQNNKIASNKTSCDANAAEIERVSSQINTTLQEHTESIAQINTTLEEHAELISQLGTTTPGVGGDSNAIAQINTTLTNHDERLVYIEGDLAKVKEEYGGIISELIESIGPTLKAFTVETNNKDGYIYIDEVKKTIPANSIRTFRFNNTFASNTYNNTGIASFRFLLTSTSEITNMDQMFYGCLSLTSLDLSNFDTSRVTNMNGIFSRCSSLTSLDLSNFDTSKVTEMGYMFNECASLTSLDVSNFNTSAVTSMRDMFYNCRSLTSLDVSNFNTSTVTSMVDMFTLCASLTSLDVSNFNTSAVTSMRAMFKNCSSLTSLDLTNFDTSAVTEMNAMFFGCMHLTSLDLSSFDTSAVTNGGNMYNIFYNCKFLTNLLLGPNFFKIPNVDSIDFLSCSKWTNETVVTSLVNNSYDRVTAGLRTLTLKLHGYTKNALTDEQKATITSKGYTIA